MKTHTVTKARSMILTALVVLAVASSIVSALYISGILGVHAEKTTTSESTVAIPGGYLLARNVTVTTCSLSSTNSTTQSTQGNTTTSVTSSTDCLPIGYR
jgi:hypothetical protein